MPGYRLGGSGTTPTEFTTAPSVNPCTKLNTAVWTSLDLVKMFFETLIDPEAHQAYVQSGRNSGSRRGDYSGRGAGNRLGGIRNGGRMMNGAPPGGMMGGGG
mmetsp:Transcript_11347/g.20827  ORF Transcript_11347/g.20827 Transcript_11347/m.20827 type:complete len:102 (-) Transcript_11347:388-693(-)|eukprot:CAMPEP_0197524830 /NCGR_PEP_ID=MMETSP1318-20131121/10047_1 /TAXON_ID=552666 /ORGANISM="Partenskyella glossopodia, Strain RCC365" /LENGTH=101 /DNA_ID=CAMNT_0043077893 /DNA_START=70 /DNA_END=375 /DNA_ORIENTATION=-